jgi:hypothetical protein
MGGRKGAGVVGAGVVVVVVVVGAAVVVVVVVVLVVVSGSVGTHVVVVVVVLVVVDVQLVVHGMPVTSHIGSDALAVCAVTVAITKERTTGTAKPAIPRMRLTKCRRSAAILSRKPSVGLSIFIPRGLRPSTRSATFISYSVLNVNGLVIKILA